MQLGAKIFSGRCIRNGGSRVLHKASSPHPAAQTQHAPAGTIIGGAYGRVSVTTLEQALEACARGDQSGLRFAYEQEAPRMLGVVLRMVRRRALAEEIVHDSFVQVWQSAGRFDGRLGSARSWVYTILRNRALNVLRGEARLELTDPLQPADVASDAATPDVVIEALDASSALRACLERLDGLRQRLLVLAYTEGLSHGEIAERVRMPLGTVKSWIRRSLLSLRECLR